jgi:hypothetical protein
MSSPALRGEQLFGEYRWGGPAHPFGLGLTGRGENNKASEGG